MGLIIAVLPYMDSAIFWCLVFILQYPSMMFAFWTWEQGQKSRLALQNLSDFQLEKAECFSDKDREMILDLIAEWFTDQYSGERDPARLRKLGWYNFEKLVRTELLFQFERQVGSSHRVTLRTATFVVCI